MSTDVELLSLAAKAIGYRVKNSITNHRDEFIGIRVKADGKPSLSWNPLTDDGDALRLAGELLLSVSIDSGYTVVIDQRERTTYETAHGLVATRRAIVRAAAEIGRAMP